MEYLKLEVDKNGTALIKGNLYLVNSAGEATQLSYDDADYVMKRAFHKWGDSVWKLGSSGKDSWIVEGEKKKPVAMDKTKPAKMKTAKTKKKNRR